MDDSFDYKKLLLAYIRYVVTVYGDVHVSCDSKCFDQLTVPEFRELARWSWAAEYYNPDGTEIPRDETGAVKAAQSH